MTYKMTPEVAIAHIEEILSEVPNYDESLDYKLTSYDFNWLEEAKEALETRAKKKPKNCYTENIAFETECVKFGSCPSCGKEIQESMNFCLECGQALDWR